MTLGFVFYPFIKYPSNPYSISLFLGNLIILGMALYLFITSMFFNTFKNRERLPERFIFISLITAFCFYTLILLNFVYAPEGNNTYDAFGVIVPQLLLTVSTTWMFRSMVEFSQRIGSAKSFMKIPSYITNFYSLYLCIFSTFGVLAPFIIRDGSFVRAFYGGSGIQNDIFILLFLICPNCIMIWETLKSDVLQLMRAKMVWLAGITFLLLITDILHGFAYVFFSTPQEIFDNGSTVTYSMLVRRYKPEGHLYFFGAIYLLLPFVLLVEQFFLDSILNLVESEESGDEANSVYIQAASEF